MLLELPIHARIAFKISLLMYHIHSGTSPSYMSSMVTPCSASRSRGLRSSTLSVVHMVKEISKIASKHNIRSKLDPYLQRFYVEHMKQQPVQISQQPLSWQSISRINLKAASNK